MGYCQCHPSGLHHILYTVTNKALFLPSIAEVGAGLFLHNSYQNILKDIRDLVRIDVSAMNFNILPIRDSDIHISFKVFIGNN